MKKIVSILLICCALFPVHSVLAASADTTLPVLSRGHIQDLGDYPADGSWVASPNRIGTVGQSKRIEGFELKPDNDLPADIELRYNVHVQNIGWLYDENDPTSWAKNGDYAGTRGDGLRIEAIKIVLLDATGNKASGYHIHYQGHVQDVGDLPTGSSAWVVDGEQLGTVGSSLRLEALKLEIVKAASTDTDLSAYTALIKQIESLTESDYTKSSWINLQTVLKNHVVTDKNTAAEVAGAVKAIEAAFQQLEKLSTTTAYDKPGIYGPTSGSEAISQDVIITATGVTLQNLAIDGNLIIDEAVGDGDVTLNNVTVSGELRVCGGGKNSIHINGGDYQNILVEKTPTGVVRIVVTGLDGIPFILSEDAAGQEVILEGNFDSVTVNAPDAVVKTDKQTSIKQLNIASDAKNSTVNLGSQTTVSDLSVKAPVKVTGTGTVSKAEISSDNVSFEKAPANYTIDPSVVVPPVIPAPTPEPPTPQPPTPQPPTPQPPTPQPPTPQPPTPQPPTPQPPTPQPPTPEPPPGKISLSVATAPTVTLSKTYDGTTATDVTSKVLDAVAVAGIAAGDTVTVSATATYDTKNAGSGKTITTSYALTGKDAAKYSAPANATAISVGEIIKADLTLPAPITTKAYDKDTTAKQTITPTAGKMNGDVLTVTETATFDTANVGKNKSGTCSYALTGTDANNYNIPATKSFDNGEITKKTIKITGTTVTTTKTYDRSAGASVINNGASSDIISGDTVNVNASAYYDNEKFGTNKPIYVTYTLTGAAASNYQIDYENPQTLSGYSGISFIKLVDTGVINKVQLSTNQTPTIDNKTYDGKLTTNITNTVVNISNSNKIISGDTVSLTATASFENANAGNKSVTIVYQIPSGTGSENYLPPVNGTATATISPLEFDTTKNFESCSKEYDGTSKATVKIGVLTQNQLVTNALKNQNITFEIVADYTDGSGNKKSAVGSNYTIAYSFKLKGPDAENFKLTSSDVNNVITGRETGGSITPKKLTVSAAAMGLQTEKTYDGNIDTNVDGRIISLAGIVGTEEVTATVVSNYETAAVGDHTIITTFDLIGNDRGNYCIDDLISSGIINPLQLTIAEADVPAVATTKIYDGGTATNVTNQAVAVSGVLGSETVTATATYADKDVDNNKPVTITYSLEGDAAGNYLAPVADASKTAAITPRTLGYSFESLETMKKVDKSSSVKITHAEVDPTKSTPGTDGTVNGDEDRLTLTCSADYYAGDQKTAEIGSHPIKLTGTLSGEEAGNYVMIDYTYPPSGEILGSNAMISSSYMPIDSNTSIWYPWLAAGTLTPPNNDANFKLFYAKQDQGATIFYGYSDEGKIYRASKESNLTNLNSWTEITSVSLPEGYQLIGIKNNTFNNNDEPLAVGSNGKIYVWYDPSWSECGTASLTSGDGSPHNFTYFADTAPNSTEDYLIYQDILGNVYKSCFNSDNATATKITTQTAPKLQSSFSNSLLAYNGNILMLYAY